ncbi:hypothetical protein LEP1GSC192_3910 [Leptospira sp. B5-022]|nr:hypothetical protein LEP1GSC192_3910 [Leptospira sp. B5-022]
MINLRKKSFTTHNGRCLPYKTNPKLTYPQNVLKPFSFS